MPKESYKSLVASVQACTLCAGELEHGVRPVLQVHPQARVLIAGQAPGSKVHATGVPFDDPSGKRLRKWMGVDPETFYDPRQVAILPMGFCYPGKGRSGDLPPVPRCAQTWRQRLLDQLKDLKLTLVIGQYAQDWHLEDSGATLTETVQGWRAYGNTMLPLPHPSPRNNIWLKKNPWFEQQVLPSLRERVRSALAEG
ncbi:MAG: uracil-DNA glycosylase family protein [Pseudomonadales bacterium]